MVLLQIDAVIIEQDVEGSRDRAQKETSARNQNKPTYRLKYPHIQTGSIQNRLGLLWMKHRKNISTLAGFSRLY